MNGLIIRRLLSAARRLVKGGAHGITKRNLRVEAELREEVRTTEALHRISSRMAAELDLGKLVQVLLDETTDLTGAAIGAFFTTLRTFGAKAVWLPPFPVRSLLD